MKIKLFAFLLSISLSALTVHTNARAQNGQPNGQVLTMLSDFYTRYITAFSINDVRLMEKTLTALQKKYCTPALLKEIDKQTQSGDLDSDPFIKAQDSSNDVLKTLTFKKDPKTTDQYIVSYTYKTLYKTNSIVVKTQYKTDLIVINLRVIKQNGEFKIAAVW